MAFKFLEELTPFILSAYEEANMKLGKFQITLRESPERSISFSEDGVKYVSFIRYYKGDEYSPKGRKVVFSEGMTPKEKQILYSRVRAFILKNLIKKKLYADWFEVLQPAELVSIKYNPTDPIGVIRFRNRDIALMRAYSYDFRTPSYIEMTILHEPKVNPLRFLKEVKKEKAEKIQPVTEEEDEEESREHIIGNDFDIVENTTNTDEKNHGGDSTAHEVENGDSRDDGITEQNSDNSAVPAPDTADDTTEDTQSDGFQAADGESGGDSASGENGMDTILDTQKPSLSDGENHPQTTLTPEETAGSQDESLMDAQGGEGKITDAIVNENTQKEFACGEGVLDIIENFLNERSFSPPKDSWKKANSLVEEYKNAEIDNRVFRKLHSIFKKHLSVSALGKESPTLDKKLLIKKLMSFQSPYTAFKKDMTNEKVLLLVDVSGSMTNFYDLIPYFYRLTVVLKDIIVVVNYNMFPMSIIEKGYVYNGSKIKIDANSDEEFANKIYGELLKKYSIKTVINFTDFDGVDITAGILAKTNANMIIMDVYCCSVLNYQPFKDKKLTHLPEILKPFKNRITYYYGVGDFEGVIEVLNKEL